MASLFSVIFFFSSRRRHTRCALVTGVQTCALPIYRRGHYRDRAFPRPPGRSVRTVIKLSCPCHIARLTGHPKRRRRDRTSPGGPCTCRSEGHTSELQSLMRISYAVFCLKKKNEEITTDQHTQLHNMTHTRNTSR